jgi:hypothetical protein
MCLFCNFVHILDLVILSHELSIQIGHLAS